MRPSTFVDGDVTSPGNMHRAAPASMRPSTFVDGDAANAVLPKAVTGASMRPSTFVDGDTYPSLNHNGRSSCFNEAVDVCRRRPSCA